MENECARLAELIAAADRVTAETKMATIIAHVRRLSPGESVLLFTEYKVTQAKRKRHAEHPIAGCISVIGFAL